MDDSKAATDLSEFTPIYRLAVKATFWNLQMESGQSKSVEHQRPSAEENQASLDHSHFACCILQAGGSSHWSLPYPDFMKKQCKKDITSISPEKTLVNSFLVKLLFWSSQMMCWITQLFIPPPPQIHARSKTSLNPEALWCKQRLHSFASAMGTASNARHFFANRRVSRPA